MSLKFITRNGQNILKKHLKTESSKWAISIQQTVKEGRARHTRRHRSTALNTRTRRELNA